MGDAYRWRAVVLAVVLTGGCQLISGLNGLHPGTTGAGGASSSAAPGGASTSGSSVTVTSSSSAATGGSSAATGGSAVTSGSSSAASSSSGCLGAGCDGGPCDGGACPPVLVLAAGSDPFGVASDGVYLYWSVRAVLPSVTNGYIARKMLVDPPDPLDVGAKIVAGIDPAQIVADTKVVSWIDGRPSGGGIYAAPAIGGAPVILRMGNPFTLLELEGTLYWSASNQFQIASASASVTASMVTSQQVPTLPSTFDVDGAHVYWSDPAHIYALGLPLVAVDAGSIDSGLLLYDSGASLLAANTAPGGDIYWATSAPGSVIAGGKDGGPTTTTLPVTTSNNIDRLLVDGSNVYWIESGDGCSAPQLVRMPVSGGAPIPVASLPDGCITIAQDATSIFWITSGAIYQWAK